MREILFRGKDIDSGEWVQGYYTLYAQTRGLLPCILTGTEYGCVLPKFVIPETVGQYTGLTDKNGNKIFEGDIIKHYIKNSEFVKTYVVAWEDRLSKFVGKYIGDEYYGKKYAYAELHENLIYEVIGNIHDNPELLEVTINESL